MLLMERPKEVTDAVAARDLIKARNQVQQKKEQITQAPAPLVEGFSRTNKGEKIGSGIRTSYSPIMVPD
jgi:hypothetical protein